MDVIGQNDSFAEARGRTRWHVVARGALFSACIADASFGVRIIRWHVPDPASKRKLFVEGITCD